MTYLLGVRLDADIKKQIGGLGELRFQEGFYFYVGSAKRSLKARISRHLSVKKNIYWHIDYFLSSRKTHIENIWVNGLQKECPMARKIQKTGCDFIRKFGSSDCQCASHLFFPGKDISGMEALLKQEGFKNANKDTFR
jgi:sugar fermentation stimulation protein A